MAFDLRDNTPEMIWLYTDEYPLCMYPRPKEIKMDMELPIPDNASCTFSTIRTFTYRKTNYPSLYRRV